MYYIYIYIYILFTKRIEIFWFRDFSNTRDIRTYCFKYFQVYKYTFWYIYIYQNQKRKKFELFTRIFELFTRFQFSKVVYIKSITK